MIKRQTLTIIICGVLAALLGVVYFTVVAPMLKTEKEPPVPIELAPGEVYASDVTKAYMFAPVERSQMKKIEVRNDKGGYTFYYSKDFGKFVIKDMEMAPYSLQALSYLVTSTGSSIPMRRYVLEEGADLSIYGLSADDEPASYIITTESGEIHKVWVGDQIPTGGGYYCQYDGRNVVYVIGANIGLTVFSNVYDLITPTLGLPVDQSAYALVSQVGVIKNGVPFVEIDTLSPEENGTNKTDTPTYSYEFSFTQLNSFTPNATTVSYIIQTMSGLAGTKTVAAGKQTKDFIEKYGLDAKNAYFTVYYTYKDKMAVVHVGEPDEDGISHAYTSVYDTVVQLPISKITFHNWTLSKYIDNYVFRRPISEISRVDIFGNIADEGIFIDSKFGLKKEEAGQKVWNVDTGYQYGVDEVENFRNVYKKLLQTTVSGETDLTNVSDMELIASFTVTDVNNEVTVYKFYAYNNSRCFVTINDKGYTVDKDGDAMTGFYVNRENVETLLRTTRDFNNGYTIDPGI